MSVFVSFDPKLIWIQTLSHTVYDWSQQMNPGLSTRAYFPSPDNVGIAASMRKHDEPTNGGEQER